MPFCPESTLSGIGTHFAEGASLWYRRRFTLPEGFVKDRVVLHIGAADQLLDAWCNGVPVGSQLGRSLVPTAMTLAVGSVRVTVLVMVRSRSLPLT